MVRKRSNGMLSAPPPAYHPTSTSLTLSIYYNGELESDGYVGGRLRKIDYVDIEKLSFESFDEYVQDLFVEGTRKLVYTGVKTGHRLLKDNGDLRRYGRKYLKLYREYPLFIVTVVKDGGEEPVDKNDEQVKDENVEVDSHEDVPTENEEPVEDDVVKDTETGQPTENAEKPTENQEFLGPIDYSIPLDKLGEHDFFRRVDNSDEWIAEYDRRFGNKTSDNGNKEHEIKKFCPANESESADSDFCVGDCFNSADDESLLNEVYNELESEPSYNVHKAVVDGQQLEWLDFEEVVSDSEGNGDDEFEIPDTHCSSDDDGLFEDNVSDNVEVGENVDHEKDVNISEEEYEGEDVVGCEADGLHMNRVSDEEGGEVDSFPEFNENNMFDPEFDLGKTFKSKESFKFSVDSYAIKIRRSLPCSRSDSRGVYIRCAESGCPFKLNIVKVINTSPDNEEAWVLREMCLDHTCEEGWYVSNINVKWLAERYIAWFKTDPKRNVKGFKDDVETALNVEVSDFKAYRAKVLALEKIQGDPNSQFTKLWDYVAELRTTNPGSTIILGTDTVDGEMRFSKFYVCFMAMTVGFKSCRPIIGVDGCHLKGPHGGILLTAVGVDPDNGNYPIAYAVVSTENKENWAWFFSVLKADLELGNGMGYTFVSDKQKGPIYALPEVFPAAEHRFCVRHMVLNLMAAGHKGIVLKNAVWKAANACIVSEFKSAMRAIRDKFPGAGIWLQDKHPVEWSKSYFLEYCKCDMNLNNCCESFNRCILEARNKPIITMLEWIREYLMKKWNLSREIAETWEGLICPQISAILQMNGKHVGGFRPIKASRTHYQIQCSDGGQHAEDLGLKTCSCRSWQLTGIPCPHALSAINHSKLQPAEFVDPFYHVSAFRMAYSGVIMPISGQNVWRKTLFVPPLPPNFGRRVGRPARLRKRGIDEPRDPKKKKTRGPVIIKLRRFQKTIKCGHCGQPGHNALFCEQLPQSAKDKRDRLTRRYGPGEHSNAQGVNPREPANSSEAPAVNAQEQVAENKEHTEATMSTQVIHPPVSVEEVEVAVSEPLHNEAPNFSISDEPTMQGPSMFEQLSMGNTGDKAPKKRQLFSVQEIQRASKASLKETKKAKQSGRVKLRVPPNFNDEDMLLTQQSVSSPLTAKNIVIEPGKKFLDLS